MLRCEKCGNPLDGLLVNVFNRDGSDSYQKVPVEECDEDAVVFETTANWTGYELSEAEQVERIECPYCNAFPFKNEEIQVYEVVRLVCFREGEAKNADHHSLGPVHHGQGPGV